MATSVAKSRIRNLNDCAARKAAKYVLYWVQAAPRVSYNHALEHAAHLANKAELPLLCCFGVTSGTQFHKNANLRHYTFMLQGLADFAKTLTETRNASFLMCQTEPVALVCALAKNAAQVVVDMGYLRVQRHWYRKVADVIDCPLIQVETNVVVPVELTSEKEEYAARTIRPKIWKHAKKCMEFPESVKLIHSNPSLVDEIFETDILAPDWKKLDVTSDAGLKSALQSLDVDDSVQPVSEMIGGHGEAVKRLETFIKSKLNSYDDQRNIPGSDFQSHLSPYLHFGHISPIEIMHRVGASSGKQAAKDSFIEELLVRRELAVNFVYYNDNYDSIDCVPDWAKETMRVHADDKRPYVYSSEQLEQGRTHDKYWNAAQLEMVHTGVMHGYMRMYWGKKVIEWSDTHSNAYDTLLQLNDKYELDGRDPNGYAGVAWCFGKHDQGWQERQIFGKLRYMNDEGLKRKFKNHMERYVAKCYGLAGRKVGIGKHFLGDDCADAAGSGVKKRVKKS